MRVGHRQNVTCETRRIEYAVQAKKGASTLWARSDANCVRAWISPVTTQIPPFIDCDLMTPEPRRIFGVAHVLIMWVLGVS